MHTAGFVVNQEKMLPQAKMRTFFVIFTRQRKSLPRLILSLLAYKFTYYTKHETSPAFCPAFDRISADGAKQTRLYPVQCPG
jgi:hypothetical protein